MVPWFVPTEFQWSPSNVHRPCRVPRSARRARRHCPSPGTDPADSLSCRLSANATIALVSGPSNVLDSNTGARSWLQLTSRSVLLPASIHAVPNASVRQRQPSRRARLFIDRAVTANARILEPPSGPRSSRVEAVTRKSRNDPQSIERLVGGRQTLTVLLFMVVCRHLRDCCPLSGREAAGPLDRITHPDRCLP